jgi:hypothetical protein
MAVVTWETSLLVVVTSVVGVDVVVGWRKARRVF